MLYRLSIIAGAAALLCAAAAAIAQGSFYQDWIRMKGAESIRCRIISEGPDKIQIETMDGRPITVQRKDVEWMQHEFPPPEVGIRRPFGTGDTDRSPLSSP